eukprot:gene19962-26671_t
MVYANVATSTVAVRVRNSGGGRGRGKGIRGANLVYAICWRPVQWAVGVRQLGGGRDRERIRGANYGLRMARSTVAVRVRIGGRQRKESGGGAQTMFQHCWGVQWLYVFAIGGRQRKASGAPTLVYALLRAVQWLYVFAIGGRQRKASGAPTMVYALLRAVQWLYVFAIGGRQRKASGAPTMVYALLRAVQWLYVFAIGGRQRKAIRGQLGLRIVGAYSWLTVAVRVRNRGEAEKGIRGANYGLRIVARSTVAVRVRNRGEAEKGIRGANWVTHVRAYRGCTCCNRGSRRKGIGAPTLVSALLPQYSGCYVSQSGGGRRKLRAANYGLRIVARSKWTYVLQSGEEEIERRSGAPNYVYRIVARSTVVYVSQSGGGRERHRGRTLVTHGCAQTWLTCSQSGGMARERHQGRPTHYGLRIVRAVQWLYVSQSGGGAERKHQRRPTLVTHCCDAVQWLVVSPSGGEAEKGIRGANYGLRIVARSTVAVRVRNRGEAEKGIRGAKTMVTHVAQLQLLCGRNRGEAEKGIRGANYGLRIVARSTVAVRVRNRGEAEKGIRAANYGLRIVARSTVAVRVRNRGRQRKDQGAPLWFTLVARSTVAVLPPKRVRGVKITKSLFKERMCPLLLAGVQQYSNYLGATAQSLGAKGLTCDLIGRDPDGLGVADLAYDIQKDVYRPGFREAGNNNKKECVKIFSREVMREISHDPQTLTLVPDSACFPSWASAPACDPTRTFDPLVLNHDDSADYHPDYTAIRTITTTGNAATWESACTKSRRECYPPETPIMRDP